MFIFLWKEKVMIIRVLLCICFLLFSTHALAVEDLKNNLGKLTDTLSELSKKLKGVSGEKGLEKTVGDKFRGRGQTGVQGVETKGGKRLFRAADQTFSVQQLEDILERLNKDKNFANDPNSKNISRMLKLLLFNQALEEGNEEVSGNAMRVLLDKENLSHKDILIQAILLDLPTVVEVFIKDYVSVDHEIVGFAYQRGHQIVQELEEAGGKILPSRNLFYEGKGSIKDHGRVMDRLLTMEPGKYLALKEEFKAQKKELKEKIKQEKALKLEVDKLKEDFRIDVNKLEQNPTYVNYFLFKACQDGDHVMMKYALNKGADLNATLLQSKRVDEKNIYQEGDTPLHVLCRSENVKDDDWQIVKYLVQAHARVGKDKEDKEREQYYLLKGEKKVSAVNKTNDSKETPLSLACKTGKRNVVAYLLGLKKEKVK